MAEEFDGYMRRSNRLFQDRPSASSCQCGRDASAKILAFDDIKNVIDSARNLAVTPCSCR